MRTARKKRIPRPDELLVRGLQAINILLERYGLSSLTELPSDEALLRLLAPDFPSMRVLLDHFRTRKEPQFFTAFSNREATVAALRATWPKAEANIVAEADRIMAGRFDLLGLKDLSFGDPIDWQLEPISGKRTPALHWSRLNYLDANVTGDKKIIWELNRHQYFARLGQAYWLTGDERYARTFATQLESWLDQNPPKLGINWASSLEVGFRSLSWLWAFYFFKDSAALSAALFSRALKVLYLQARHLETYLSTYFSPNTHLTGEALALFQLGVLLPEFREAGRWRQTGKRILLEQLPRHVKPDGVYFEQSSYYHRYTTDFYLQFLILARQNQETLPLEVEARLKSLLDHLMYITRPDGTTPFFGDDDGGRLARLDQRPVNDFRATLATAAALLRRGDYKYVAGERAQETLWLLGAGGLAEFERLVPHEPARQSMAFPDGGYFVMRDSWTRAGNYLLIDCGPHGMDNCGHAHADALSFDLAVDGRTLLVDPGTYTYTGSPEARDWFRGSSAHNALTISDISSSSPAGPFSWQTIARARAESWISRERFDYFQGRHDGYERLPDPVAHSRAVLFLKRDYWVIRDRPRAKRAHRCQLWFHFEVTTAPVLHGTEGGIATLTEVDGHGGLDIVSFARKSDWRRKDGWLSHCYGERTPAPVFVFSAPIEGAEDLVTLLLPRTRVRHNPRVTEVETIGGRAFEVIGDGVRDLVMIKSDNRVETASMASDFDWTWARFAGTDTTVPEELILIGGQSLELRGKEVLRSGRRINYLVASRAGDQFRIETDDGVFELSLPIHDFESVFSDANRIIEPGSSGPGTEN